MKRIQITISLISVLVFFFLFATKTQAAYFKFNQSQVNVTVGQEFDLQLIVDPEGEEITSVDAYLQFDQNFIEGVSVTQGDYFPTVINNISASTIYIAGMVDYPASPKTGVGTVATVKFRAKTNGTTTIGFICEYSKIVKNDTNYSNILTCEKNQSAQIIIGTGANNSSNSSNNQLPKTGIFDQTEKFLLPGVFLMFSGILGRFLLKL